MWYKWKGLEIQIQSFTEKSLGYLRVNFQESSWNYWLKFPQVFYISTALSHSFLTEINGYNKDVTIYLSVLSPRQDVCVAMAWSIAFLSKCDVIFLLIESLLLLLSKGITQNLVFYFLIRFTRFSYACNPVLLNQWMDIPLSIYWVMHTWMFMTVQYTDFNVYIFPAHKP